MTIHNLSIICMVLVSLVSLWINPLKLSLKVMTKVALLIGLGVILGIDGIKISISNLFEVKFDTVPIILSGLWFGPSYGILTGFLIDILQLVVSPTMNPYFGFTLNLMLTGFIAGLLSQTKMKFSIKYLLLGMNIVSIGLLLVDKQFFWLVLISIVLSIIYDRIQLKNQDRIFLIIFICEYLIQMGLTSLWLMDLVKLPYITFALVRMIEAPIMICLLTFIISRLQILKGKIV